MIMSCTLGLCHPFSVSMCEGIVGSAELSMKVRLSSVENLSRTMDTIVIMPCTLRLCHPSPMSVCEAVVGFIEFSVKMRLSSVENLS